MAGGCKIIVKLSGCEKSSFYKTIGIVDGLILFRYILGVIKGPTAFDGCGE